MEERERTYEHPSREPQLREKKRSQILEACRWNDTAALRALATAEGGFLSDDLRRQAWPLLLGDPELLKQEPSLTEDWKNLPKHRDEEQVRLDVERSFIYYPNEQSSTELDRRKRELSDLITEVLRRHPYLCYFQGYHDICQVFLLVLESYKRVPAVARLSILRIRDFMLPTLGPALAQLRLIPSILRAANPELCSHISQTEPFFALSGTLTMYAHDIQEYGDIARLFDVLLAREPVFSVYLFAEIVLQRSDELFEVPADEPEMLHSILSKLPKPLDIETLIRKTALLLETYPPENLSIWYTISKNSVLKTARGHEISNKQSLEDGKLYFQRQIKELQWSELQAKLLERAWQYRKPIRIAGMALLVGFLSTWFRRPATSAYLASLWRHWAG